MEYVHTSTPVHIVIALSLYEFIYTDTVVSYAHELIGICVIYVAFAEHICYWYIYGYNMVSKVAVFLPLCAVMWDLHVDYIISAVGYTCVMWQTYLSEAYINNMKFIPVLVVTFFIAVSSCEVYIDIAAWYLHVR